MVRVRSRGRGMVQIPVLSLLEVVLSMLLWFRTRENIRYKRIAWYVATGHRDAVACSTIEVLFSLSNASV